MNIKYVFAIIAALIGVALGDTTPGPNGKDPHGTIAY
ncbi:hypothetical protein Ocin01_11240 [Orchesella cincta]|uniref:Uncharacterized protein n=1 Tax=Orchesella cincta TaxID=48709 RepID=A0A1D2MRT5_ORCCI|nr:hypothetical protein Ocin01_11242 [Orchesella cincta]ODM95437.1 hypothetical protein Ocin01_11240 [Orchesella cincta]